MSPKLFPTLIIIINLASAMVYACHGDWRKLIYWLSAATLTAAITY